MEEARESFRQALSVDSSNTRSFMGLGRTEAALGDQHKSLAAYWQALSLAPDNLTALLGVGKAAAAQGDDERALKAFTRATRKAEKKND